MIEVPEYLLGSKYPNEDYVADLVIAFPNPDSNKMKNLFKNNFISFD